MFPVPRLRHIGHSITAPFALSLHTIRLVVAIVYMATPLIFWYIKKHILRINSEKKDLLAKSEKAVRHFVKTANKLKGGLIKVGQLLSSRADILPPEFLAPLSTLQDRVTPTPWYLVEHTLKKALKNRLADFTLIEHEAIAAASFGQVHRAILKNGEKVAIKVQHPAIKRTLKVDMALVSLVFAWLNRLFPEMQFKALLKELINCTWRELDYQNEAENGLRLAHNFALSPKVVIPKIYREYSGPKVLVLSFIDGIKITDFASLKANNINGTKLMTTTIECYAKQFFLDGFFQADPHPGNLFALEDGRLGIVDFGLAKELSPAFTAAMRRAAFAILSRDGWALAKALSDMGCFKEEDIPKVLPYLQRAGRHFKEGSLGELKALEGHVAEKAPSLFAEVRFIVRELNMELPEELVLLGRTMGLLQGLSAQLAPDLQLFAVIMPILLKMVGAEVEIVPESENTSGSRRPRRSRRPGFGRFTCQ